MQDRYTGDVGDFGKYGLLSGLCLRDGQPALLLGVVWYLASLQEANADGKHVGYLLNKNSEFRACDNELFDKLRTLLVDLDGKLITANRQVALIKEHGILPSSTIFYENLLLLNGTTQHARQTCRHEWFRKALRHVAPADLIFLDPDNGIECSSASATAPKSGPKYVLWQEIEAFANHEKSAEGTRSLVIYHHLNMGQPHKIQVRLHLEELKRRLPLHTTSALIFNRGTSRAFFIAMAPKHKNTLSARLADFIGTNWNRLFDQIV